MICKLGQGSSAQNVPRKALCTWYEWYEYELKLYLEESFASLLFDDLLPAVDGSRIHFFALPGHHHQASPDGIEGVGDGNGTGGDSLKDARLGHGRKFCRTPFSWRKITKKLD